MSEKLVLKVGRRMAQARLVRLQAAMDELGKLVKELMYEDGEEAEKAEERVEIVATVFKTDDEKRLLYGLAMEPDETDSHGEYTKREEIEAAAHGFMQSRVVGLQHQREAPAEIVESYIAQSDMVLGGQHVKAGSWLVVMKILEDELWKTVKQGAFGGISIGGWARREDEGTP